MTIFLLGNFTQRYYIPRGMFASAGRILIGDTDHDGNEEFYIHTYGGPYEIYVYELHTSRTWEVDSFFYLYSPLIWDLGDFDQDGYWDMAVQASATEGYPTMVMSIAETPDSFSYPTQEVWRDTVGPPLVSPICAFDIDQDSYPELVKVLGDTTDFDIYEAAGNDGYVRIFRDTMPNPHGPTSNIAFGDFDSDGKYEFVFGNPSGEYDIWECVSDNNYEEIIFDQLPTTNLRDCFTVPDADGDGKWEFVLKGYTILDAEIHVYIFEATADNTYEIIQSFTLPGGDYSGGFSDAGDVDGDSIPEIVLEARYNVFILKASSDNSFYIWDTLPGCATGSNIRLHDCDDNGLNEIVISNVDITRGWEYDGGGIEERTTPCMEPITVNISPNPFKDRTTIKWQMFGGMESREPSDISLHIFDVTGSLVKQLFPAAFTSFLPNVFIWDGTDQINRKVTPGVYYIVLKSSDKIITKKIVKIQ